MKHIVWFILINWSSNILVGGIQIDNGADGRVGYSKIINTICLSILAIVFINIAITYHHVVYHLTQNSPPFVGREHESLHSCECICGVGMLSAFVGCISTSQTINIVHDRLSGVLGSGICSFNNNLLYIRKRWLDHC